MALKQGHHFFAEAGNDAFIVNNIINVDSVHKYVCAKKCGGFVVLENAERGWKQLEKPANDAEIGNEKTGKPDQYSAKAQEG